MHSLFACIAPDQLPPKVPVLKTKVLIAYANGTTAWALAGWIRLILHRKSFDPVKVCQRIEAHRNCSNFPELLQALRACNAEVKCVLPGAPAEIVAKYQSARVEIFTAPVEPGPLLREADVVINYGSAGLIAQSLLAGVPLLLLCNMLEHIGNSLRVVEIGAGIAVIENRTPAVLGDAIRKLTSEASYRNAARDFASKYRGREQHPCEVIVRTVEGIAAA